MPLFEVPYRTPFIAVARAHSEAIAAQAYARRSWALDTQRALALAALRPRGLDATVAELGRRLGVWVGMYDAAGALQLSHPRSAVSAGRLTELGERGVGFTAVGVSAELRARREQHVALIEERRRVGEVGAVHPGDRRGERIGGQLVGPSEQGEAEFAAVEQGLHGGLHWSSVR
jgi:hypothetical protein